MAQTTRASVTLASPSTEYRGGANIIAQSQSGNYSTVRISATAINRGGTTSFSGNQGTHATTIVGYSGSASRSGTIPSGVPADTVRWDVSKDITVPHAADGTKGAVTIKTAVSGWHTGSDTGSLSGFTRIPKPASKPGTPVASEILPTSIRLTWTAPTDNGGSAVTGYLVRRWDNPEGTGAATDTVFNTTDLTQVLTDLTPGKQYRFAIYAINGSYAVYSEMSDAIVVETLSGFFVKIGGAYKRAVLYVKVSGLYKAATLFVKIAGVYKRGG